MSKQVHNCRPCALNPLFRQSSKKLFLKQTRHVRFLCSSRFQAPIGTSCFPSSPQFLNRPSSLDSPCRDFLFRLSLLNCFWRASKFRRWRATETKEKQREEMGERRGGDFRKIRNTASLSHRRSEWRHLSKILSYIYKITILHIRTSS